MVTYAHTRCTCGYDRFREARATTETVVERWMSYIDGGGGGYGSTPFGTFFGGHGSGSSDGWGLFPATMTTTTYTLICESCSRMRKSKIVGAFAPYGGYVQGGEVLVVGSDFRRPTGCYSVELVGNETGERYLLPLTWVPELPPPLIVEELPETTAPTPPPGAETVNALLTAELPEIERTQEFTLWLVNSCAATRIPLVSQVLESPNMLININDADLGGAPRAWLDGVRGRPPASALGSGVRRTIPFDRCSAVIEYNARLATLPAAQGFTHAGAGSSSDYQLIPGGLLAETASSLPSYFEKTVAVGANPTEAYVYYRVQPENEPAHAAGEGTIATAQYAQFVSNPYVGASIGRSGGAFYATALDGATDGGAIATPQGWAEAAAYAGDSEDDLLWVGSQVSQGTYFGNVGSAGALETTLIFGDVAGSGVTTVIDSVVGSFGGRFIRPRWGAIAPVASPVVRVYGFADPNSSVGKLITLRVRAMAGTSAPLGEGATAVDAVLNVTAANAVFSLDFGLSGLTAGEPFSFTLERVWDSVQDTLEATFHVLYLTVRSS